MKLREAMVCWNPRTAEVRVGQHPDRSGWSAGYVMSDGACRDWWRAVSDERRLTMLLVIFHTMVVGDAVDARAAHRALCAIDESADVIAPDIPGARRAGRVVPPHPAGNEPGDAA